MVTNYNRVRCFECTPTYPDQRLLEQPTQILATSPALYLPILILSNQLLSFVSSLPPPTMTRRSVISKHPHNMYNPPFPPSSSESSGTPFSTKRTHNPPKVNPCSCLCLPCENPDGVSLGWFFLGSRSESIRGSSYRPVIEILAGYGVETVDSFAFFLPFDCEETL